MMSKVVSKTGNATIAKLFSSGIGVGVGELVGVTCGVTFGVGVGVTVDSGVPVTVAVCHRNVKFIVPE